MIGSYTLWWIVLGWPITSFASSSTIGLFAFDWYSLHSSDIRVQWVNYDDEGGIDLNIFEAPRIDGGWVLWHYRRAKDVTFKLSLKADTVAGLNALIDELKKKTQVTEGRLEVEVDWVVRRTKASITSLKFNREYYHITFLPNVEITFRTIAPHRQLKLNTSYAFEHTGDVQEDVVNNGTRASDPVLYIILKTGSVGVTEIKLTNNWYAITIDDTFLAGDLIAIDCENKVVTKNGVAIDYTGVFPTLEVWSNALLFDYTSTSVLADIFVIFNQKFL